jgi:hypothetical protein
MRVPFSPRSRRAAWNIDHINNAPDSWTALQRAWEFFRKELRNAERRGRHEDAEGFRWQYTELLAAGALTVPGHHPDERFRNLNGTRPRLQGGGWTPVLHQGEYPQARQP